MKATMDRFKVIFKSYYKLYTNYKANLLAKLVYLPIRILILFFLWSSISKHNRDLDLKYIMSYYIMALLISQAFPYLRSARDMEKDIIEGSIAPSLTRPMDYLSLRTMAFLSRISLYLFLTLGIVIIVGLINNIQPYHIILFIIMMLMGMFLQYFMWTLLGLSSFWLERNYGVLVSFRVFIELGSGLLIPLNFLRSELLLVFDYLPFKYILYEPIDFFLGKGDLVGGVKIIGLSGFWIIIFLFLTKLVWKAGLKEYSPNFN